MAGILHTKRMERTGSEPDYRFSLANERTFLAWIRTALALDAVGLAVIQVLPPFAIPFAREALGIVLVGLGTAVAGTSYRRWEAHERAMREQTPLPSSRLPLVLATGVATFSIVVAVLLIFGALA
jgi:putative membrane protein